MLLMVELLGPIPTKDLVRNYHTQPGLPAIAATRPQLIQDIRFLISRGLLRKKNEVLHHVPLTEEGDSAEDGEIS